MLKAGSISWLLVASFALIACGGGEEQPAQQPQQPPPGMYAPQQQQPQQQQQPAPGYTTAPDGTMQPAPAQPAPAQPATTAQPQMGFPCQADTNCIAHKCDTAAGRCIFPCQTNNDCQPGFRCMAPLCLPGQ